MNQAEMREQILNFPHQLLADLETVNLEILPATDKFILCGMGGSALAGGLLRVYNPELDLLLHRDYGLPRVPRYFLEDGLLILSSYSGDTEEVLDTLARALARGLSIAVLTSGGRLLAEARRLGLPHVILPTGLPPRLAVGYAFNGLCRLCLDKSSLEELRAAGQILEPAGEEIRGRNLAEKLGEKLPLIYSSALNLPLAYDWKIVLNETGKTAAFYNVLPELNHNEMLAPDSHFFYIFLRDSADDVRIQNRFAKLSELFQSRDLTVEEVVLPDKPILTKIFSSVVLANWSAYYLALARGRDPVEVDAIEKFKQQLSQSQN